MRRTCKEMNSFLEEIEGKLNVYSRFDLMIQVEEATLEGDVVGFLLKFIKTTFL